MTSENKKAIAVYLDDDDRMEVELSWLYKSWILNNLDKEWDLVVYYNPIASHRLGLLDKAIKISMKPIGISDRYPFLNSHYFCLSPHNTPLRKYEYLLKTDCDVFLTSNLRNYSPGNKFHYGQGGYYSNNEAERATQIAWVANRLIPSIDFEVAGRKFNLKHQHLAFVGASFLGTADKVLYTTSLQALMTQELLENHFGKSGTMRIAPGGLPKIDRNQRTIGPNIAEGIASMLAGEIIVNSLYSHQHVNPWSLDTKCWDTEALSSNVIHIHAWHSAERFSKHDFFLGNYKDWKVHYDDRLASCGNYCQWIATTPLSEIEKIAKKGN